ncbi:uncharacterized protein An02g12190 [Aspergillus niger]|uniref:Contig An02c0390, genomic contig n=2 Tax=Aspergillus niger TaxID=5061 RepID=A2QET6_ASPNC|nr:uncharacterized protein An02g12190 [Aspergillus niger]CAK37900.1 unnamed protein product [Aspergillus niger]
MRIRRIANWDLSGLGQSIPEAGGDSDTPDLIVTVPAGGKTTNGAALFGWFVVGESTAAVGELVSRRDDGPNLERAAALPTVGLSLE